MTAVQTRPGSLTEPIASALHCLTSDALGWCVYRDHAGAERQRLWAHLGEEPSRGTNLSGVDILLANTLTKRALLVLEIEETSCPPKTLLGDILGVALSDYVSVEGDNLHCAITHETELWLCYVANPQGHQRERNERTMERLQEAWGGSRPLPVIRLVAAESRDGLVDAVVEELRIRFAADGTKHSGSARGA